MDERPPMERVMSTGVVMGIVLSHLKVRDLLSCRKVSKFWNKAASSVLRNRSTMIKNISSEAELMELGECMSESSDFPFAGLKFREPWKLRSAGAIIFFRNHGPRFTRLHLGASLMTASQDLAPFVNRLPRLSILEVYWAEETPHHSELLDFATGSDDSSTVNLTSLRTLKISCEMNEDVLGQVLAAASHLLQIECLWTSYGILKALKTAGKLQAVCTMNVNQNDEEKDHALRVDEVLLTTSPSLRKLCYNPGGCLSLKGLQKILLSSRNTLKILHLDGICPSQISSECPVLPELTKLSVDFLGQTSEYVFQGRQGYKFPALKELELDNKSGDLWIHNLSDGLFVVPSLTTIKFEEYFDKTGIEELARSFPNVIEIQLQHFVYDCGWFGSGDPIEIWSIGAFKFLEKLKIWTYTVKSPTKYVDNNTYYFASDVNLKKFKMMNMDSFLTGIPVTICENLRKQNQQNLMNSPFNDILRDSPNILQLKNLKELIISVTFEHNLEELPEEPPFISMVSVWYALQMMPNLKAKFVYDYSRPSRGSREEYRDKAVKMLKDAFRHVEPYVKLEPFFY